jgi:hypothetical protein
MKWSSFFTEECHTIKGKQTCSCFYAQLKAVNCFNSQRSYHLGYTSGLYYESFRIIIYDRNDSTIVELVL